MPNMRQAIIWANDSLFYRIYPSPVAPFTNMVDFYPSMDKWSHAQ